MRRFEDASLDIIRIDASIITTSGSDTCLEIPGEPNDTTLGAEV